MNTFILFGTWGLLCVGLAEYQFPENFPKCHLNDKNLDRCLAEAIETAFHLYGKSGVASINLPSMDPIAVSNIKIGAGTGAVNLVQRYHNAHVYGTSDTKILRAHFDQDKYILNFTAEYPEIRQEAEYHINGKVMMLPVYGHGDSTLRMKETTALHVATFKKTTKNGKEYIHVDDYKVKVSIKGAHYDFQNLFDGDQKLSDIFLKVINDNWIAVFEDVREGVEKTCGAVFKAIANKFFDTVPFDEIFLK